MSENSSIQSTATVVIPKVDLRRISVRVVGQSPLITHAWSEKAKKMMLDKQMKKAPPTGRPVRDPHEEFLSAAYWITPRPSPDPTAQDIANGTFKFGVPATAFKRAMVDAASFIPDITKVLVRGAVIVEGELLAIEGPPPRMREDLVTVGMGSTDLRYRPEWPEWAITIPMLVSTRNVSIEQAMVLLQTAGMAIGVCEMRPQCNGNAGRFRIEENNQ